MLRNWKSSPVLAGIALLAVTAVWGWTFLIVKDAISKMPVMDFLAVRFCAAAIVMFIIRPTSLKKLTSRGLVRGIILGFLLGMGYITQTYGLRTVSPAVSGFITGMSVVFTPVLSWALLRRRISGNTWIAAVLAIIGLALLSLHGWAFGTGELFTLACAIFIAVHILGLGEWSQHHETYSLALVQITTVAVMTLIAAAPGGITLPPDITIWGTVGATAVLATAFAFLVQTWAQTLISPTHTAVILTMEPVFAGFFAIVIGGDRPTVKTVAGALCVLAAMLIAQLKKNHPVKSGH